MRPEEIDTLNRARSEIVRCLIPTEPPFLDHLVSKGVLSSRDVELIQKTGVNKPNADTVQELLWIYTRKATSLEPLIEALNLCCYSNLVKALTQPASADNAPISPTITRRIIRNALNTGRVPHRPDIYVERRELLEEIRKALIEVGGSEEGGWVIIHGMPGIGKSVLAAAALDDPTVIGTTFSSVYWIYVGPHGEENLLRYLVDLFAIVDKSERSLQFDQVGIAKAKLRDAFQFDEPKALIVLDDVWQEEIIRVFNDLGCRILATVRDTGLFDVISGKKEFVRVPDSGFSQQEAMEVLAKWSKIDVQNLPMEAEMIYQKCAGHPFGISLIGSLLRDHQQRWAYYCEMLRLRKFEDIKKRSPYKFDNFVAAAELSLDNLPDELKKRFQSLGVFQRGAEIPVAALMVFWSLSQVDVEDVMLALANRSLVERHTTNALTTPKESYRIHLLLHETLKKWNGPDVQKNLHMELLKRYSEKSDGQWNRLPRDGYIYEYLAYHFFRSNDGSLPWNVFLDLSFVVEKLIEDGPVKLLTDYKRYEGFIGKWGEAASGEFQDFVRKNMHALNEDDVKRKRAGYADNVLKLALKEPGSSAVHRQARRMNETLRFAVPEALENGDHAEALSPAMCVRPELLVAKQAVWMPGGNGNAFTVITESGTLRICSSDTGRKFFKIKMEYAADCISISPNAKRALVCCGDGLYIYDLPDLDSLLARDGFTIPAGIQPSPDFFRTPSPLLNFWPASQSDSESIGGRMDGARPGCAYQWCEISHDGSKAISGDTDGCLLTWKLAGDQQPYEIGRHAGPVNCCKFNANDDHVASVGDDGMVIVWSATTRRASTFFAHEKRRISSCCWINRGAFAGCILTNSYADFAVWTPDGKPRLTWTEEVKVACMDVSKCGNYVAAGLIDGAVVIWHLKAESPVRLAQFNSHTSAVPMSIQFHSETARVLMARQDGIVEIWNVQHNQNG